MRFKPGLNQFGSSFRRLPATGHALATSPSVDAENAPGKPSAKPLTVLTSPGSPPRGFGRSHGPADPGATPGWALLAPCSAPNRGQAVLLLPLPLARMPFCLLAEHEKYPRGLVNVPGLRVLELRGFQVVQLLGDNVGNPGGTDIQNKKGPPILPSPAHTRYFGFPLTGHAPTLAAKQRRDPT